MPVDHRLDDPAFSAILRLAPDAYYTFRAYATLDGREYIYSESREYRTGNAKVFTLDMEYYGGFGLELSGRRFPLMASSISGFRRKIS